MNKNKLNWTDEQKRLKKIYVSSIVQDITFRLYIATYNEKRRGI